MVKRDLENSVFYKCWQLLKWFICFRFSIREMYVKLFWPKIRIIWIVSSSFNVIIKNSATVWVLNYKATVQVGCMIRKKCNSLPSTPGDFFNLFFNKTSTLGDLWRWTMLKLFFSTIHYKLKKRLDCDYA